MGSNPLAGSSGILAMVTGASAGHALSIGAAPTFAGVCAVLLVGGYVRRRRDLEATSETS